MVQLASMNKPMTIVVACAAVMIVGGAILAAKILSANPAEKTSQPPTYESSLPAPAKAGQPQQALQVQTPPSCLLLQEKLLSTNPIEISRFQVTAKNHFDTKLQKCFVEIDGTSSESIYNQLYDASKNLIAACLGPSDSMRQRNPSGDWLCKYGPEKTFLNNPTLTRDQFTALQKERMTE